MLTLAAYSPGVAIGVAAVLVLYRHAVIPAFRDSIEAGHRLLEFLRDLRAFQAENHLEPGHQGGEETP